MIKKFLNRSAKVCFYLFFAFVPFRVGTFLFTPEVYSSGLFNPYTGYFLHVSEILLVVGLLFLFAERFASKNQKGKKLSKNLKDFFVKDPVFLLFIVFVFLSLFSVLFSVDARNSVFYVIRFVELIVVYKLVSGGFLNFSRLMGIFVGVMFIQSIISILQYYLQTDLGLRFFGEPVLDSAAKGIASVDLYGDKVIRPYGTFAHPNILGMYMVFAFWFLICLSSKIRDRLVLVCLGFLFLSTLLLSFSRSAWLAFVLSGIFYMFLRGGKTYVRYIVSFVILFFVVSYALGVGDLLMHRAGILFADSAFSERLMFMDISVRMLLDNPFGVGIGNFTVVMQDYSAEKLFPWNFQPVHNIFLLAFAEVGWIGGLSLIVLLAFVLKKAMEIKKYFLPVVIGVCVLAGGLFDHYFLSLFQGQVLFVLFLASIAVGNSSKKDFGIR